MDDGGDGGDAGARDTAAGVDSTRRISSLQQGVRVAGERRPKGFTARRPASNDATSVSAGSRSGCALQEVRGSAISGGACSPRACLADTDGADKVESRTKMNNDKVNSTVGSGTTTNSNKDDSTTTATTSTTIAFGMKEYKYDDWELVIDDVVDAAMEANLADVANSAALDGVVNAVARKLVAMGVAGDMMNERRRRRRRQYP